MICAPSGVISRTRLLPESATHTLPSGATLTPQGSLNFVPPAGVENAVHEQLVIPVFS